MAITLHRLWELCPWPWSLKIMASSDLGLPPTGETVDRMRQDGQVSLPRKGTYSWSQFRVKTWNIASLTVLWEYLHRLWELCPWQRCL